MRGEEEAPASSEDEAGGSHASPTPQRITLQPLHGSDASAKSPSTDVGDVTQLSFSSAVEMLPTEEEPTGSEGNSHRQKQQQYCNKSSGDGGSSDHTRGGYRDAENRVRRSSGTDRNDFGAPAEDQFRVVKVNGNATHFSEVPVQNNESTPQNTLTRSEDPPSMTPLLSLHGAKDDEHSEGNNDDGVDRRFCLTDLPAAAGNADDDDGADEADNAWRGSPFQYCRNRPRGPPAAAVMTLDVSSFREAGGELSSCISLPAAEEAPLLLPSPQRPQRSVSSDGAPSVANADNSGGERKGEEAEAEPWRWRADDVDDEVVKCSSPLLPSTVAVRGHAFSSTLTRAGTVRGADDHGSYTGEDGVDSTADSMHSSPPAVTLWGADRDLRRKRIKKVSHYILGPLLGEGSYGVVRDCIDLNTDNPDRRFSRCAIKIISGNYAKFDAPAARPSKASPRSPAAAEDGSVSGRGGGRRGRSAATEGGATGTLKRTSGLQYRREEDLKRQEMFQREMRNLQRFHCKNIIRALDTFTRYSKEYVVMPIAICSLRQLVQQLLRTRWSEAVREWERAQRRQRHVRGGFEPTAEGEQTQSPPQLSRRLPKLPPAVEELDIDDLTFFMDDDADSVSANRPHSSGDDDSSDDDARTKRRGESQQQHRCGTRSVTAATVAEGSRSGSSCLLPRATSNGSSSATTTTTTTTPVADSYMNCSNVPRAPQLPQQLLSGPRPRLAMGQRHSDGNRSWEDGISDGSTASTAETKNCIAVMSATPPALSTDGFPVEYDALVGSGANGAGSNRADSQPLAGASPAPAAAGLHSQPRMPLPMCSPTLLKGIFYQLISAVAYLHQQRLAHNDIKPSNVLLFEDGTVKLADLGSVSDTYNDQGSPLCASPELCKYFYGASTPPASFSQSTQHVGRDAAQSSDMWCCGLMLYYLITGKPGPLPAQVRYFRALHRKQARQYTRLFTLPGDNSDTDDEKSGVADLPPVVTRYQLYREIAQQKDPVDLSGLPDMVPPNMGHDVLLPSTPTLSAKEARNGNSDGDDAAALYPPNSVRHLLAGLLELDPLRRLTAEQALRHPWLQMAFRSTMSTRSSSAISPTTAPDSSSGSKKDAHQKHGRQPSKQAMEEAIQRDVARRVMESRHVQHMVRLDRQRHLQFVADCCNMLNLDIPPEIIKVRAEEPRHEDGGAGVRFSSPPARRVYRPNSLAAAAAAVAGCSTRHGARSSGTSVQRPRGITDGSEWSVTSRSSDAATVTGVVLQLGMRPRVMPPGCVDTDLFLPPSEEDYYEQKSGKAEFDVRVLRHKPLLMAQLDEYFHNVVLVQCGYRTGPDPDYQAMRVQAVPIEDEDGGDRHYGGVGYGSRGGTQQPAVMILSGASGSLSRRSPSAALSSMPAAAVAGELSPYHYDISSASSGGGSADVWGAGPRHQPHTPVDGGGEVMRASSSADGAASLGVTACRTSAVADRSRIDTSLSGAAVAAAAEAAAARATAQSRSSAAASLCPPHAGSGTTGGSGRGSRHVSGKNGGRGRRNCSESPSEEEGNVAMRESSKCLCGLV
ncbi:hypothetical protein CUR178_08370 [Leishmania enriettii]|uniref:Protein kinase domain-containing protein n=1 Tax=Leishmania enriettii TaxID=5663 RepID=A0A836I2S1_LEIEN|nr:hypothetical protein CUR178_08370 [Leishmania enriettii]